MRLSLFLSCLVLAAGSASAQTTTPAKPAAPVPAPAKPAAAPTPAPAPAGARAPSPERLFADWDKDKNQQLSLEEFRNGLEAARTADMLARFEQQFRAADKDRSGFLEAGEYSGLPLVKRAGGGAPPFSTFDANKDSRIDFQEYLTLVEAMLKRAGGAK